MNGEDTQENGGKEQGSQLNNLLALYFYVNEKAICFF
jgi:hypothetical protein